MTGLNHMSFTCSFRLIVIVTLSIFCISAGDLVAQPRALMLMDADTGEVLFEDSADLRLHPAGLTKLMSLYVAFDSVQGGEVGLDELITISSLAANEPAVELGLKAGMKIKFRHLLRAAGVQGANDAATAIAETISGSEKSFVNELNVFSAELGLSRSTWKNPHGLTEAGHMSTARDISVLMIKQKEHFPEYFNLFGRRSSDAGLRVVANSSRRLLAGIQGVEVAKYGHTRAARHNGVVYVTREGRSLVAVVFGATTTLELINDLNQLIERGFEAEK